MLPQQILAPPLIVEDAIDNLALIFYYCLESILNFDGLQEELQYGLPLLLPSSSLSTAALPSTGSIPEPVIHSVLVYFQ